MKSENLEKKVLILRKKSQKENKMRNVWTFVFHGILLKYINTVDQKVRGIVREDCAFLGI